MNPRRKVRRWSGPHEDEAKFRELVVYIAQQCSDDPTFGALKLDKLLFHADFLAYGLFGKPITGAEYMKLPDGPVPRHLVPIRDKMKVAGEIAIEKRPVQSHDRPMERVVALRDPDLTLFSAAEIALVDSQIREWWGKTAKEFSDATHRYRGWRIARNIKDTIPYPAVFLSDEAPTDYDRQRGLELIAQYGWDV